MLKRGSGEASVENGEYCNANKRFRQQAIPLHNQVKSQSFETYSDLITNSTKKFQGKHLITLTENRIQLKTKCLKLLNEKIENPTSSKACTIHTTANSELYKLISDSCQGLAKKRLKSLLQLGKFNKGGSGKRNTIVVSAGERILLHIEKSKRPAFHLKLKIEQKTSLSQHLVLDESGKIFHYKK